jgi:hypothetical protein
MQRDKYLATLAACMNDGSPSGVEAVSNTLLALAPQLSREEIAVKMDRVWRPGAAMYVPTPPVLIDDVVRVLVVRAWSGELPTLTLGGIVDMQGELSQHSYLRQKVHKAEANAAIGWARANWGLIPRPAFTAMHIVVDHGTTVYPVRVGYSDEYFGESRPFSTSWSAAGHIWTGQPFECEELSVRDDRREPIMYCGGCSYVIQPGMVCPVCQMTFPRASTLALPASAPCEVVAIAMKLGHVFTTDPRQARIREYGEWMQGVTQQLKLAAPAIEYNKLQRSVEIGHN